MPLVMKCLLGAMIVGGCAVNTVRAEPDAVEGAPSTQGSQRMGLDTPGGSKLGRVANYIEALKKKTTALESENEVLSDQVQEVRSELVVARQQITDLKASGVLLTAGLTMDAAGEMVACPWARLVGALSGEAVELLAALAHDPVTASVPPEERRRALARERRLGKLPRQVALAPNDSELARSLTDVALALQRVGQDEEAEAHFAWAVMILEASPERQHLATALALENLASHYLTTGGSRGAEGAYRLALAEYRYLLDPDHPKLAGLHNRLASSLHRQGRLAEAEETYLQSIALCESKAGRLNPNLLAPAHNLAKLLLEAGRRDEAAQWLERAQQIVATHASAEVYAPQVEQTLARLVATRPEPDEERVAPSGSGEDDPIL